MAKAIIKKAISDPQLKTELFKLFEAGNTDKGKCREVVGSKYKIQVQRFYKMFNVIIQEWQEIKDKAEAEQVGESTKDALKIGLKSKITRQLEIQAFLDPSYRVEEIVGVDVKSGKVIRAMRTLTPTEIRNYHAELSKMDDSYTPTKVADVNPDGSAKVDPLAELIKKGGKLIIGGK